MRVATGVHRSQALRCARALRPAARLRPHLLAFARSLPFTFWTSSKPPWRQARFNSSALRSADLLSPSQAQVMRTVPVLPRLPGRSPVVFPVSAAVVPAAIVASAVVAVVAAALVAAA